MASSELKAIENTLSVPVMGSPYALLMVAQRCQSQELVAIM